MEKSLHVLLVEDNEGDIVLTQEAFEERKIVNKLSVARNGQEALDFLSETASDPSASNPDIILLDLNLPIKNGFEVLKQIKTEPETSTIPVIVLTTSSSQRDINKAYERYANSFITKPLDIDDFIRAIIKVEQFWLQLIRLPNVK
ncbi:MAG: response regulator [Cryomorphaceae bacterium]|nr:response regulator [Flavobacteriales bacterium]